MKVKQLTHQQVLSILPDRSADTHKGCFGRILLLCGSRRYTGAAALAAMGALRTGAGLVYLAVPESIYTITATKLTEPIILPLPDMNGAFSTGSLADIRACMDRKDAVLIGPGIGLSAGAEQAVCTVLEEYTGPVVLDADGITLASAHKDILRGRTAPTILTPHSGEFQRIAGPMVGSKMDCAAALARELGVIILLKGQGTAITDGTNGYINPTGNPGMATGGSGDVLAGMITALIGQGIEPLEATACAAWLHGAAGDICANELGQYALLPSDMLNALPRLLK